MSLTDAQLQQYFQWQHHLEQQQLQQHQQHPMLAAVSGNNYAFGQQRAHHHKHNPYINHRPLSSDASSGPDNHSGPSGASGYGGDSTGTGYEYHPQEPPLPASPPQSSQSHPTGGGHSFQHPIPDSSGYSVHTPSHPPINVNKKKQKKKGSSAITALTLLAFLFFVNLLQSCLKEHMDTMNPTVMVMTAGVSRNRFNKLADMNSREQSSSSRTSATQFSSGANIVVKPADLLSAAISTSAVKYPIAATKIILQSNPYVNDVEVGVVNSNNALSNGGGIGAAGAIQSIPSSHVSNSLTNKPVATNNNKDVEQLQQQQNNYPHPYTHTTSHTLIQQYDEKLQYNEHLVGHEQDNDYMQQQHNQQQSFENSPNIYNKNNINKNNNNNNRDPQPEFYNSAHIYPNNTVVDDMPMLINEKPNKYQHEKTQNQQQQHYANDYLDHYPAFNTYKRQEHEEAHYRQNQKQQHLFHNEHLQHNRHHDHYHNNPNHDYFNRNYPWSSSATAAAASSANAYRHANNRYSLSNIDWGTYSLPVRAGGSNYFNDDGYGNGDSLYHTRF